MEVPMKKSLEGLEFVESEQRPVPTDEVGKIYIYLVERENESVSIT
jgi:hypothetical protein